MEHRIAATRQSSVLQGCMLVRCCEFLKYLSFTSSSTYLRCGPLIQPIYASVWKFEAHQYDKILMKKSFFEIFDPCSNVYAINSTAKSLFDNHTNLKPNFAYSPNLLPHTVVNISYIIEQKAIYIQILQIYNW
ncbi:hypothetical protein GJ496_008315 [Pomphorhynchus laevis]|nr:hypothetical protein GJ496_008315 [Pomphorhynchus laevis]